MNTDRPRLTTNEVAALLKCEGPDALPLLRAAGVPYTRATKKGMILWDKQGVDVLLKALGKVK